MALPIVAGALFSSVLSWLASFVLRKAVIGFFVLTILVVLIETLGPVVVRLLLSVLGSQPGNFISLIPDSVWWFGSVFRLDFGLNAVFSAYVTRFLIRRIPVVG